MPAAIRQQGVGALKLWSFAAKCKGKWQKKRRRQKPAARSRWFESLILDIVGALISAALIKLLGLNQSSKVGPGCGPAPTFIIKPKQKKLWVK